MPKTRKNGMRKRQYCFGLGGSKRHPYYKGGIVKKNGSSIQQFEQNIVLSFLVLLNTVKLYHWKTQSYATHKATDELYSKLNSDIDHFIEVLLGKVGNRVNLLGTHSIPLKDYSSNNEFIQEINRTKMLLVDLDNNKAMNVMSNSDLYNIRDEILGDLNQFLYLLTFR